MSQFAEANLTSIRRSKEVTWGETPVAPTMKELPVNSYSLKHEKDTVTSNRLRSDRQRAALVEVGASASGSMDFELSAKAFDWELEGLLCEEWLATDITDDVTFTATTAEFAVASLANVRVGQWLKIGNAGNNDGVHKVTGKTATILTFADATFDVGAVVDVTVKGNILRNGVKDISFLHEERFNTTPAKSIYFTGVMINEGSFRVEAGSIVSGSFGVLGKQGEASDDAIATTVTAAETTEPLNATANVGNITEAGSGLSAPVMSVELSLTNNLEGRRAIGSKGFVGVRKGTIDVTGTLTAYFADTTLYQKLVDHEASSFSFRFTDLDGNIMIFTVPKLFFGEGAPSVEGINTDVMLPLGFTGVMDPVTGCTIQIDAIYVA